MADLDNIQPFREEHYDFNLLELPFLLLRIRRITDPVDDRIELAPLTDKLSLPSRRSSADVNDFRVFFLDGVSLLFIELPVFWREFVSLESDMAY